MESYTAEVRASAERTELEDSPSLRSAYRVSIFGSGDNRKWGVRRAARAVAELLVGLSGFKVVTGGENCGAMRAAHNAAHRIAERTGRPDLEPEGVLWGRTKPPKRPGTFVMADSYQERLRRLVEESDAYVALSQTPGTILETFSAIEHAMEANPPKPVIIFDTTKRLERLVYSKLAKDGASLPFVFTVRREQDAQAIVEIFYKYCRGAPITATDMIFLQSHRLFRDSDS